MPKKTVLVCSCGDCDDWVIGRNGSNDFIKCMTCGDTHSVTITVPTHAKLSYRSAKPALARGKKLGPSGKRV